MLRMFREGYRVEVCVDVPEANIVTEYLCFAVEGGSLIEDGDVCVNASARCGIVQGKGRMGGGRGSIRVLGESGTETSMSHGSCCDAVQMFAGHLCFRGADGAVPALLRAACETPKIITGVLPCVPCQTRTRAVCLWFSPRHLSGEGTSLKGFKWWALPVLPRPVATALRRCAASARAHGSAPPQNRRERAVHCLSSPHGGRRPESLQRVGGWPREAQFYYYTRRVIPLGIALAMGLGDPHRRAPISPWVFVWGNERMCMYMLPLLRCPLPMPTGGTLARRACAGHLL